MIFEADVDQITRLSSLDLVRLMKRLMLAECLLVDIPLRNETVPLQITVSDGGEDGRVEWTGGLDATDWFPARFCAFQSKAQNVTESSIKAEILKKPKKGRAELNAAISEVLSRRGAYVLFCSRAFTGQKITKLKKAIVSAIRAGRRKVSDAGAIEIYDANRIADWVNTQPSAALWLAELQRRRSLAGFLSFDRWGRAPEIANIPWNDDGAPRFVPVSLVVPHAERTDVDRNAWTFEQTCQFTLRYLADEGVALRVVGPSGFGKSRFVYELFNCAGSGEVNSAAIIYADFTFVGDEVLKLGLEIADASSPTILIVDECSDEIHTKLAGIAQRAASRMRLVTIDVETKLVEAAGTFLVRLEPAADELIASIAKGIAPNLSESNSQTIRELAHGFPQMAVLAAQQDGQGRKTIQSAEQVLDRIVWGRRHRNDDAQRALECLSLFEWVGLAGRTSEEGAFIARSLVGVAEEIFVEHIKSFLPRGIVIQRGDFVQVTPIPLAVRLGNRRLSLLPAQRLAIFFAEAPTHLKKSLLRRMRWLDTSTEAKAFARGLIHPSCMGNLTVLNTDFGAECLDHIVHIDPDLAIATIEQVFGGLTDAQLRTVNAGRRHLVWALEKLVFRKESFDAAATLLRRLAAAETEDRISNNATGQFKQLYQLYLSGTEASPDARLLVLDDGLRSENAQEREVCIEALDHMLVTHHFSRGGGAEEIGSGERLTDWAPKTYQEVRDFYRAAVNRLTEIAVANDPLSIRANKILGSHIRGLIGQLPLAEIKEMVARIVSRYGFWPEAVQETNEWLYFDRKDAPKKIGEAVRAYFDELMPVDPVELAILYTYGWQTDFHDPDQDYDKEESDRSDYDYSTRKAAQLAEIIVTERTSICRMLDAFVASDAKGSRPFARRLAEVVSDPRELFNMALTKVESRAEPANLQFFAGLISGADGRDPTAARDCVRAALRSEKLKKHAISMIGAGKLQIGDIKLVVSLLQSHDIQPWECANLSYGRGMEHLNPEDIVPLLQELIEHGGEGLWTVLRILAMVLFGGKNPPPVFIAILRDVLVAPALFEKRICGLINGHHFKEMVKVLARHNSIDQKFARTLAAQLFSICERSRIDMFHTLDDAVRTGLLTLIGLYPKEVWSAVVRLLLVNDPLRRHQFESLVRPDRENYLGPGLLYAMPANLYLDWTRKDPSRRASIVMEWLPLATKGQDGALSWHPVLKDFIAEFGPQDHVLNQLSIRLYPRSWWGSLAPHLAPLIPLLESWSGHSQPVVRQWSRDQISRIRGAIEDADRRSDEDFNR